MVMAGSPPAEATSRTTGAPDPLSWTWVHTCRGFCSFVIAVRQRGESIADFVMGTPAAGTRHRSCWVTTVLRWGGDTPLAAVGLGNQGGEGTFFQRSQAVITPPPRKKQERSRKGSVLSR